MGPWGRLDEDKPFIGRIKKPQGAAHYPEDMTKEDFNRWIKEHPEDETAFRSNYTVIRRQNGRLVAVPYSIEYGEFLKPAARLLEDAAGITENDSLRKYLTSRAGAFRTNDYTQSEIDWLNLDSKVEVVIGPVEVYEDGLLGLKAGFESVIGIRDKEASDKLKVFNKYLDEIDRMLPITTNAKFSRKSQVSPVSVVTQIWAAGEKNKGIRTSAFNLPNDDRVRQEYGSKKVFLKNIMEAKFENSTLPIARRVIDPHQVKFVTFDAYLNTLKMHEDGHGMGPGRIKSSDGRDISISDALAELYSPVEELKADLIGIFGTSYLVAAGVLPRRLEQEIPATSLALSVRGMRFGAKEAHGKGHMILFNYLNEKDAIYHNPANDTYIVLNSEFRAGVGSLLELVLNLQAEGNYDKAKWLVDGFAFIPPRIESTMSRLSDIPTDIKPSYVV